MGQKPRYLTPTIFAKISSSCSNLIIIITCCVMNVSIFLYPSLTVESEVQLIFFVGETILPYKLRLARTKIRRPLWRNNFHANKANAFLYQICVLSDTFYTLKVAQETIRSTLLHRKKVRFEPFLTIKKPLKRRHESESWKRHLNHNLFVSSTFNDSHTFLPVRTRDAPSALRAPLGLKI